MKRKIILRLSLMIVFLTVFWSCHSEDFTNGKAEPQRNNANFFLHSTKGGAAARGGVDYAAILEAYNRENDFLATMPDQQGMPIWDKMQVVDTDHATGLMIPLSHDNETMSSVLFATLDGENAVTGVADYDNKLLESIVNDQRISKLSRERLFYTFMYMDNKTFGNEYFIGIPKDLFIGDKSDGDRSTVWMRDFSPATATASETGKIIIIESCVLVLHCTHHGTGACDAANGCTKCGHTECSYQIIITGDYDPFPSSPGGGCSECGGGGTPGPQPPVDPCAMNTVFYRIKPGCLGSGGDTGVDGLEDPCKKIKSIVNNPQMKIKIDSLKEFSLTAVRDERGYHQDKSGNITPAALNGAHHVDFMIGTNSLGGIHNHTLNGDHIFSPRDILTFLSFARVQNQTLPIGSTADHTGNAFLGMIAQSASYFITFNGGSEDLPPPMTDAEEFAFELEMNKAFKKILKLQLKAEGKDSWDNLSDEGLQKLFFDLIKEMGFEGKINLIQQKGANTSTIQQNPDGTIKDSIPC